jgi:hypothetical protein
MRQLFAERARHFDERMLVIVSDAFRHLADGNRTITVFGGVSGTHQVRSTAATSRRSSPIRAAGMSWLAPPGRNRHGRGRGATPNAKPGRDQLDVARAPDERRSAELARC